MPRSGKRQLIMDANVLIDLADADRTVIRSISDSVGRVHVPTPVLEEEVEQIDTSEYDELGIVPVEPSLEIATAAAECRGGLSFHDHLCLLLARENSWTCVTNDVPLRRECASETIPVLWGLQTVALLVDERVLQAAAAGELARAIQRGNPRYITNRVLADFLQRIGVPSRGASGTRRRKRT